MGYALLSVFIYHPSYPIFRLYYRKPYRSAFIKLSFHYRYILLVHFPHGCILCEHAVGIGILGYNQYAARISVKPVYKPHLRFDSILIKIVFKGVQHGVFEMIASRMHYHSEWLFYDEEIKILIQHLYSHLLGFVLIAFMRKLYLYYVSTAYHCMHRHIFPVYSDRLFLFDAAEHPHRYIHFIKQL